MSPISSESKLKSIAIANKKIGLGHPCMIIAEAGINHNGKLQKALKMIEVAKKAGANAIKFQTYDANQMIVNKSLKYSYKSQGKKITESMLDMFQRCEFSNDDWFKTSLNLLKDTGILGVPNLQKFFNKNGKEIL